MRSDIIVAVITAVLLSTVIGMAQDKPSYSTVCIDGYKYVTTPNGGIAQMMKQEQSYRYNDAAVPIWCKGE